MTNDTGLIEKVKDVALFDGWKLVGQPKHEYPWIWLEKQGLLPQQVLYQDGFGKIRDLTDSLCYHWDWRLIMQVIDKIIILDDGYFFEINYPESCGIFAKGERIIPVTTTKGLQGTRNVFETIWKFIAMRNEFTQQEP